MTERLYRHPTDRAIAGVAGGLAAWLNIDPSLVRIAWVVLAILSGGIFVLVYIVMMIIVPLAPPGWTPRPRDGYGPGGGSWAGGSSWGPGTGTFGPPGTTGAPGGWPGTTGTPGAWPPADGAPAPSGTPAPGGWQAPPGWGPQPRPSNAGIVVGIVLVAIGVWFLIDQYVHINWDLLWPVAIMVLGGALIAGALMRGRSS